jgi:hypothetical protein
MLSRETGQVAMVLGTQILIGVTVLAESDLWIDCRQQRLHLNPAHPGQPVFRV